MTGLRVLVLSRVFPNPVQPTLGVFIHERVRRIAQHADVRVVAPVAWFPFNRLFRGRRANDVPAVEARDGVRVYHPRFVCVPGVLRSLDGVAYAASLIPFLLRLRREFPFDVIDAHFAYPDGLAATLLGALFRRPVVTTLRGSIVRLARSALHRPQLRVALRAAARVMSVSEALKTVAVRFGAAPAAIRVVPNGVDTGTFFPRSRAEARRALGLSAERPIVVSVAAVIEHKGHHRVIAALPDMLRQRPDLLYVIVGGERRDGWRRTLEALVARHGLQQHVLMAGEQPHDRVPLWLAAADVFCLASRSEGWPNSVLEALACGRPVVATRVGGVPEIVTGDALGVLVPPEDDGLLGAAIVKALDTPWDVDVLAAHARAHSWDTAALAAVEELRGAVRGARERSVGPAARPRPAGETP